MKSSADLKLTPELGKIVNHDDLGMIICAPAGCGKTEALALRVRQLLNSHDFTSSGRRILILTFTNNARDNIGARLLHHLTTATIQDRVTLCNFHGLASRIILNHGYNIGFDESWHIANTDWLEYQLNKLGYNRKLKQVIKDMIHEAKLTNITDDDVIRSLNHTMSDASSCAVKIERYRIRNKIITYDDQVRIALWILKNKKVLSLYRNHFFAGIVDEFQDLTPQQLQLATLICRNNITYAGDVSQAIYSFAGANVTHTLETIKSSGICEFELTSSFRSSPSILRAINALQPLTQGTALTCAFPEHWGEGGMFGSLHFNHIEEEARWIVAVTRAIHSHCPQLRIGIISRSAFRMKGISQTLADNKIPHYEWGDGRFSPTVADILRDICLDPSLPKQTDLAMHIRNLTSKVTTDDSEELRLASFWLCDQLSHSAPQDVINKVHSVGSGDPLSSAPGIHCLTGHAGKGQQFDWVFIPGLEEGCIPDFRAETADAISEEARVLSVMLSRARIGAVVSYSLENSNRYATRRSRFLSYLERVDGIRMGRNDIISWFQNADWNALAFM